MIHKKSITLAFFALSLTGCQPTPPSYVPKANALLEKQITKIAGERVMCQFTYKSGFWFSACTSRAPHASPLFALFEPEGVMQASDNLAIFVTPVNNDARYYTLQSEFTIPATTRKIPVNADEVINSLMPLTR
ncbi:hypothetical protein [Serratia liquefaciens]|uniref:hypothetical protein n=1 Tax=Serratia liquefaciens TaxID=614 RepID=UPI00165D1D33|nr:hypothetical protein [Serratia liquefaciens]MBV0841580.1 hypothetical protein [Serratia liquefaciens]MDU5484596.1 hypothetical protein [Serratia liquefaciens]QNQ56366.1 hypothetical protein IAI46_10515 [Serratia liquefaciens]HEJ7039604.1 hypothetical protein [Serratia liquefaciens]HEJ8022107.1 hypothetical protein [Serratia liquefaciens]